MLRSKLPGVVLVLLLVAGLVSLNSQVFFGRPSYDLALKTTDDFKLKVDQDQASFRTEDVAQLQQGEMNSLILTKQGKVYVNGDNRYGQLGSGKFGGESANFREVELPEGAGKARKISLTHRHMLAMTENGDVWAWGFNLSGQIGNNSRKDIGKPVKVFSGATDIAAGYRFSAAIRDGQLWAWGMQCDPGTPGLEKLAAAFAHDISVGGSYYDGRSQSDAVYCLEEENLPIASITPRRIEPDNQRRFTAVSAGYGSLLMLDDRQGGWGFGCNAWGQLGRGHTRNDGGTRKITRIAFPEGTKVEQLSAGFRHGIALDATGKLWSWGHDMQGDPLTYRSNRTDSPEVMNSAPSNISSITAGHDASGVLAQGRFYASGDNQESQISRELGDKRQYVVQNYHAIGSATNFSLGYVRHIYW